MQRVSKDQIRGKELLAALPAGDGKLPFLATRRGRWIGRAGIVLATVIAYSPLWHGDFIWDDPDYIINNWTLRSLRGLWSMWVHPYSIPQYYPLVHTTFWIEYHLWDLFGKGGLWPVGYHIDNVLLHALSALVLWEILDALAIPGAVLAAALFALHPVHVESVAWVTERKNVLSGLLYLLSLRCFLRQGITEFRFDRRWYTAAMLLFIGALLSKSVTCTLPAVILILAWWKTGRIDWRRLAALAPMLLIGGVMAMVTAHLETVHVMAVGREWWFSTGDRLAIAGRAAWFYPWKLLWPTNLAFIYPKWTLTYRSLKPLVGPALAAVLTAGLWLLRDRIDRRVLAAWMVLLVAAAAFFYPRWMVDHVAVRQLLPPAMVLATAGALWLLRGRIGRGALAASSIYLVTILPALGFANIYPMRYTFVADHYVYLASLGILVPAAALVWKMSRPAVIITSAALVISLMALTMSRAYFFQSAFLLWTDAIDKNFYSWMVHDNMGHTWNSMWQSEPASSPLKGVYERQAEVEYKIAARLADPVVTDVHWGLAGFYLKQNRLDEADAECDRVLMVTPGDALVWCAKGSILHQRGMMDEAIATFRKAAKMSPGLADPHYWLASLYDTDRHDDARAEPEYRAAIACNPNHVASHYNLGNLLLRRQDYVGAINQFQTVLSIEPNHPEAMYNMATAYLRLGDRDNAASCAAGALRLDSGFAPARDLLMRLGAAPP